MYFSTSAQVNINEGHSQILPGNHNAYLKKEVTKNPKIFAEFQETKYKFYIFSSYISLVFHTYVQIYKSCVCILYSTLTETGILHVSRVPKPQARTRKVFHP
jgi:hypothetical protein